MESIQSDDPTAIIGLPLIALTSMLARFGLIRWPHPEPRHEGRAAPDSRRPGRSGAGALAAGRGPPLAGRLDTYIAENAKTARAFLKLVGTERPLQEITIHTLSDKADDGQIQSWLQSARQGGEIGLVSRPAAPPSPTPAPRSWPPPTAWASRCDPGSAPPPSCGLMASGLTAALRLPRLCAGGRGRASQAAARLGAAFRPPRPDPAADRNPLPQRRHVRHAAGQPQGRHPAVRGPHHQR